MTGLVRKDLYLARSMARSYVLLIGVFGLLSVAGVYDSTFISSFLGMMMTIGLPTNVFAYDEQAKWDRYAAAGPRGRKRVVGARYLFLLVMLGAALALCAGLQMLIWAAGQLESWSQGLAASVVCVSVGGILNAILIPLLFRFGTQKGRIMLLVAVGVGAAASAMAAGALAIFGGQGMEALLDRVIWVLPLVAAALLALSFAVSRWIYGKKEL